MFRVTEEDCTLRIENKPYSVVSATPMRVAKQEDMKKVAVMLPSQQEVKLPTPVKMPLPGIVSTPEVPRIEYEFMGSGGYFIVYY